MSLRSALFVDFDNVLLGLKGLDEAAAEVFATNPQRWVDWLEAAPNGQGQQRRFLSRNCYLNPQAFARYRAIFIQAGFTVVDCPPLTVRGKNSADIRIVMDVLDLLDHPVHYDDFVIASADADFIPVLQRLRAHDRRTTVIASGPVAPAYRANSDTLIDAEAFIDALSTRPPAADQASLATEPRSMSAHDLAPAVTAMREAVAEADKPVSMGALAGVALRALPALEGSRWAGRGTFRSFVAEVLPEFTATTDPSPGYVYDTKRHQPPGQAHRSESDVGLMAQVARVTGAPNLDAGQYAALFRALSDVIAVAPESLTQLTKQARDRLTDAGYAIGRNSVAFVAQGLAIRGLSFQEPASPERLATETLSNLLTLCSNAGFSLTEAERDQLTRHITGGVNGAT